MYTLIQKKEEIITSVTHGNRVLIVAHRGSSGGNIVQNTIRAFMAAERQGADIIEIDISRTADGELFVYHDGAENYSFGIDKNIQALTKKETLQLRYRNSIGSNTTQGVQTLDEVLKALKGEVLINIDRGWDSIQEILEMVDKHDMGDQIIIKGPARDPFLKKLTDMGSDIMCIPIVQNKKDLEKSLSYNLNYLGIEVVFKSLNDDIVQPETLAYMKTLGLLLWGNAIQLKEKKKLAEDFDDVVSILEHPDKGWGKLLEMGFNIIQTDWPWALRDYLQARGYAVKKKTFLRN